MSRNRNALMDRGLLGEMLGTGGMAIINQLVSFVCMICFIAFVNTDYKMLSVIGCGVLNGIALAMFQHKKRSIPFIIVGNIVYAVIAVHNCWLDDPESSFGIHLVGTTFAVVLGVMAMILSAYIIGEMIYEWLKGITLDQVSSLMAINITRYIPLTVQDARDLGIENKPDYLRYIIRVWENDRFVRSSMARKVANKIYEYRGKEISNVANSLEIPGIFSRYAYGDISLSDEDARNEIATALGVDERCTNNTLHDLTRIITRKWSKDTIEDIIIILMYLKRG